MASLGTELMEVDAKSTSKFDDDVYYLIVKFTCRFVCILAPYRMPVLVPKLRVFALSHHKLNGEFEELLSNVGI